jgi:putative transferase (TIGR04331 family)
MRSNKLLLKRGGAKIHPKAVCESSSIGRGTRIWANVHVLAGASIGTDCNICEFVFIENNVKIGDRTTIKSGVQIWDQVFISDDVFKAWAARKVEKGAPFVIGQHGGNYGMALWNFSEDHQLAIADRYMTWGWIKCGQENIDPIGNFKKMLSTLPNCNGSALLVETTVPLQGYHMFSAPVGAGQWQEYFHDQTRFVMALPENLRTKLLVRLSPQDYGYSQKQRWKDFFPNIELDSGSCPISTLMNRSRISIITYNATAYLESMALNFPTIIFWNPIYWELRKDALPIFEKLKKVGIFHEAPESAAQHLENIWNGVSDWWFSAKVQAVRMEFCEKYVRTNSSIASSLAESFRKLS